MAKNWWLKFEYRVWQSDPALSQCSLAARGFWLEMLCAMHAQDVAEITGTFEQIGRMARCEATEVAKYSLELKNTKTANVTLGHGEVTLMSRRLKREVTTKENNRLRKQKERVTKMSQDIVRSKELSSNSFPIGKERKEAANAPPLLEIFLGTVEAGLTERLGIKTLPNKRDWHQKLSWAFANDFTASSVLECYDLLKKDSFWKDKSLSAKTLTENLANLPSLRAAASGNGTGEKLRSLDEMMKDREDGRLQMRKASEGIIT